VGRSGMGSVSPAWPTLPRRLGGRLEGTEPLAGSARGFGGGPGSKAKGKAEGGVGAGWGQAPPLLQICYQLPPRPP